jgi:hypothetical protein
VARCTDIGALRSGYNLQGKSIFNQDKQTLRIITLSWWNAERAFSATDSVVPVTMVDQLAVPSRAKSRFLAVVPT